MDALTENDFDTITEDEHDIEAGRRMVYCDQCGTSTLAKMHGILGNGEVKWCQHCTNLNAAKFNADGGFLYEIRS